MVCPDFKGFGVSFKVVAEGFKSTDNGEEFFIMDVIVLFGWEERLREVHNRVPLVKKVRLFENSSHSEVTCICDETERA